MSKKPPLGLSVEIEVADGTTYTRDPYSTRGNVPEQMRCRSQYGDGFAEASVLLARRITRDYPDLGLFDTVRFIGHDGASAYEGRHVQHPGTTDPRHEIELNAVGWMSHTRDRIFQDLYANRDLSGWKGPSRARQVALLSIPRTVSEPGVVVDESSGLPALELRVTGAGAGSIPTCEAWFDAGFAEAIGSIYHDTTSHSGVASQPAANWDLTMFPATDDTPSGLGTSSGDLHTAAGGSVAGTFNVGGKRCLLIAWLAPSAAAAANGEDYFVTLRRLALFGNQGLTKRGTAPDQGYYASDVMRDFLSRFCPKLNLEIDDTTYPIKQISFLDGIEPYDAITFLNGHHLWHPAVWEDRAFHYSPIDLNDFDWEVRLDDPGTRVRLQGDSAEDLASGVIVNYTDFTGVVQTIYPTDYPDDLLDTSEANPAVKHGIDRWRPVEPPFPAAATDAVQWGRAHLADFNQPKAPGTIRVHGHIRDRAGNWQQGWKVRAGDRIAITDHPNDRPRLVADATWDGPSKTLDISVDREVKTIEGLFNRIETARRAAGLAA